MSGPVAPRAPQLAGQTVVLIGGSAGTGLEAARLARAEGADVILTGRNPDRLEVAAREVGALAGHLMANAALTGATYDIDGGQQFVRA
jgi:NADP-dependent 3-hydroxy acid dehydrogenase YdfG